MPLGRRYTALIVQGNPRDLTVRPEHGLSAVRLAALRDRRRRASYLRASSLWIVS